MAGEKILAERLPFFSHEQYGSDKEYVENLIKEKKINREFYWSTSEDSPCYKKNKYQAVTAAKPLYCYDECDLPLVYSDAPAGVYQSEL